MALNGPFVSEPSNWVILGQNDLDLATLAP